MSEDSYKMWLIEKIETKIMGDPVGIAVYLMDQISELKICVEVLAELAIKWGAEELPELNDKQFTGLI